MYILKRLLIGFVLWVAVVAVAQRRPPNYSQDRMPVTSFSCRDKIIGGYYADPETDCQMFHVCVKVPGLGVQDYKFLCPNDTSFDQENQICDDWFNIDCEASTLYYSDNFDLYRIGGDIPRTNIIPRLPSNNINNAVSENDDDLYLQKADRGEHVESDLLRGSHTSNFFSNKNRGREDDDYPSKDEYQKKSRNNNVRKLLTGKRPIAPSTQAPIEENKVSQQYRPRSQNFVGRVSQFQRNQHQSTEPPKITETYNRQTYTQRNFYSPTTPKIETTPSTQKTDYIRNYTPTKRNFFDNTQNYNTQTTPFIQTTRNYQNFRTTTTQAPTTLNYYETTVNYEKKNNYETQKLFKLNTGAVKQYDDSEDEFLKTAPSLNLAASALNSFQNSFKNFNTSVSSGYSFNPVEKSTTVNYQAQTYFNPTTQRQNFYNPSTVKPYQQDYYTSPKSQAPEVHQQNLYNPQTEQSTTAKYNYQYIQTTQKPFYQQNSYSTVSTYSQYNPTTFNPFQNQFNQQDQQTKKPVQPLISQPVQQTYKAPNPPSQQGFQPQRNTPSQNSYQQVTQKAQQQYHHHHQQYNPTTHQVTDKYYSPTTLKPYQTVKPTSQPRGTKFTTVDATERPRPFTQDASALNNKDKKKEKEQYDYAYYDDGTQSEYDNIEQVEDFSKTRSKN